MTSHPCRDNVSKMTNVVLTDTLFSTRSPGKNTTEVIYVSREDVTELTIIVWTVGGVLLVTLLALLGRIILARRKDPFLDYERRRRNVLRIRIDSQFLQNPADIGFTVPRDTTDLVNCAASTPAESPVSQRNPSTNRTAHSNSQNTTNNSRSNSRSNSSCSSRNNIQNNSQLASAVSSAYNNINNTELRDVYDTEENSESRENAEPSSTNSDRQLSTSALDSCISTSGLVPSSCSSQSRREPERNEIQNACSHRQQNNASAHVPPQSSTANQTTGSRVLLSNGVVISPPPYCDVVNATARLPSVVVSRPTRPPSRQLLFSL